MSAAVGDVVWIEDLERYGVVLTALTGDAGTAYVCQTGDTGGDDFAAVPAERATTLPEAP